MTSVAALLLAVGCKAPTPKQRATWTGEAVAAYAATLPVLDDLPSYDCPGPADDDRIDRLLQVESKATWQVNRSPTGGRYKYYNFFEAMTAVPADGVTIWEEPTCGRDVTLDLTFETYGFDSVWDLLGEREYDVGTSYPRTPGLSYNLINHAFYTADGVRDGDALTYPCDWNDHSGWPWHDADHCFYPLKFCIARYRPLRFAGTYWFDGRGASAYGDKLESSMWFVWDAAYGVRAYLDSEYHYSAVSDYAGRNAVSHNSEYMSEIDTDAFWAPPDLSTDTGE